MQRRSYSLVIRVLPLVLCGAVLAGTPAHSQTPPAVTPVVTPEPAPAPLAPHDRALAVLKAHCARCHEASLRAPEQPANALQNILDLDALQARPGLVQPGRPDASQLYTVMLRAHAPVPMTTTAASGAGPTPEEIDDVRAWITGLPVPSAPTCSGRRRVTLADLGSTLERLRKPGGAALKGIRFISLAGYHNACASAPRLEELRRAVSELVMALRTTLVDFDLPLAGDDIPVLAVRLGDMGWDASQWDALAALGRAPHVTEPALADAFGTETPLIDVRAFAAAAVQSGEYPKLAELGLVARSFLLDGSSDIDMASAANDLGLPDTDFAAVLDGATGSNEVFAKRLRQGLIPRAAWRQLRASLALPGDAGLLRFRPEAPAAAGPENDAALDVGLWSDRISYKTGDLIVVTAQVNRDCHLTLINIDTHGDATVLFPSDSDPDNAVKAGAKIRIPSDIEPYQLRANEAGTETFVAVCTVNRKRMIGVEQDFEKQRFTILGDWRTFLKTAHTREAMVGRRDTPRQRRARAKADAAAKAAETAPELEARGAIYVKIE